MARPYRSETQVNEQTKSNEHVSVTEADRAAHRDRMAMYSDNALKIGLFGANCSSGRAVTQVPERWTGNWEDNLALARMCDAAGIEFMLPVGRWKGYGGDTDYMGTTLETITWATGLLGAHQAPHRVRHRARAAVPSDHRGQAVRHRRPRQRGPLRPQHRGRLERGRVPDVRRDAARARAALRLRAGMDRRGEAAPGARRRTSTSTASSSSSKKVRAKPKPYGGSRPLIMNAGASPTGRAFAIRNCDAFFTQAVAHLDGRDARSA